MDDVASFLELPPLFSPLSPKSLFPWIGFPFLKNMLFFLFEVLIFEIPS